MYCVIKVGTLMSSMGIESLDVYILFICKLISFLQQWFDWLECVQFSSLYIIVSCLQTHKDFLVSLFFSFSFSSSRFVGISSTNSHEASLVHLNKPRRLKGLLQMLNATVIPMKVSKVLRLIFLYFARGRAKARWCGVNKPLFWPHLNPYLIPFSTSFMLDLDTKESNLSYSIHIMLYKCFFLFSGALPRRWTNH